jgi:2-iminobutanoate/2-iminopropanoate deaminase
MGSRLRHIQARNAYVSTSPLSQAVICDGLVYCSGQVPVFSETGESPQGIEAQTRQALDNLKAILESAGCNMSDVIKSTVFLVNAIDFPAMNGIYQTFFAPPMPARTAVIVAGLARPEWLIEVEAVAAFHGT